MSYLIKSARYANPEHTSAIADVDDTVGKAVSALDSPADLWNAVLAADPAPFSFPFDRQEVNNECSRRIYEVVNAAAQQRLQNALVLGKLSPVEAKTFKEGDDWIGRTVDICRALKKREDPTFADDDHWEKPDPRVVALAKKY